MKIIKYRCDRCCKDVSINNLNHLNISDYSEDYEILTMDLCNECTRKLTQCLGVSLIMPEELPFE